MNKQNELSIDDVAKKESDLTEAEETLKKLKTKTQVKLGAVPFIAGVSNKISAE